MNATRKRALLAAGGACSLLVMAAFVLGLWRGCNRLDEITGFDRKQDRAFRTLRNGMAKTDVFKRMRVPPIWTNSQFTLGQYEGNEKEYAKTNNVRAVVFYTWANGIDWFYCVGFGQNDRLVVKGEGGT